MLFDLDDVTPANARDVLAAVPDAVALAMGAHPVRNPHPFAELVAESPLRAAAFAAGQILRPRQPGEVEAAVIGRGVRTQDFASAIAAGVQAEARRRFDLQAQHTGAVSVVEVTRLGEPEPVGAIDLSVPLEDVGGLEYKTSMGALRDGESITLSSLGRLIGITREAVFNDSLGLIEDAIAATGVAAARHEARLVAAALETTGNLVSDGTAVFDAALHGNVSAAGGVLSSATVGDCMRLLRLQLAADGEALNAAAAFLIVSPLNELAAWQIVSYSRLPVEVLVLTGLDPTRFYLVASKDVHRNIAVARLEGAAHPLAVEAVRTPISYDGAILRVRIDTGAAMVGRLGIVRAD